MHSQESSLKRSFLRKVKNSPKKCSFAIRSMWIQPLSEEQSLDDLLRKLEVSSNILLIYFLMTLKHIFVSSGADSWYVTRILYQAWAIIGIQSSRMKSFCEKDNYKCFKTNRKKSNDRTIRVLLASWAVERAKSRLTTTSSMQSSMRRKMSINMGWPCPSHDSIS